jgi:transcriptional regulator with XRE-family HTH domain
MAETLNEAIARRVRRLREERGWTQDRLADRLREAGFTGWSRSMVAALETRRRQVSAGDLIALSAALGVPPADLVPRRSGSVSLDNGSSISLERAVLILGGGASSGGTRAGRSPGRPARPTARGAPSPKAVARVAKGELERRLARILGVRPEDVAEAALRLWGHSATEERDRRAPDPGRLGVKRDASRWVRQELEVEMKKPGRETRT